MTGQGTVTYLNFVAFEGKVMNAVLGLRLRVNEITVCERTGHSHGSVVAMDGNEGTAIGS